MLNEIFNSNITPDPLLEEEGGDVMNQGRKNKEDEFLNEEFALSMKSKCSEILNKYCTLYDKDKCVQPLNINYVNKKARKEEMKNTTGPLWYNMKAPELTPELKEDLKAMQIKQYTDPTQFFKKNDKNKLEKFFQTISTKIE